MPKWIPLADASRRLAEPYQTTHRRVLTCELDAKRQGRAWLVTDESVDRVLREREAAAAVA